MVGFSVFAPASSISALLVDQTILSKLNNLNPNFVSSLNANESDYINSLEERGHSMGEYVLAGTSFFLQRGYYLQ